jgi:hypothetical protein
MLALASVATRYWRMCEYASALPVGTRGWSRRFGSHKLKAVETVCRSAS